VRVSTSDSGVGIGAWDDGTGDGTCGGEAGTNTGAGADAGRGGVDASFSCGRAICAHESLDVAGFEAALEIGAWREGVEPLTSVSMPHAGIELVPPQEDDVDKIEFSGWVDRVSVRPADALSPLG